MTKKKSCKKQIKAFGGKVDIDPISQYLAIQNQRVANMPDNIQDPNSALTQNSINLQNAKSQATNHWLPQTLAILGAGGIQMGSKMLQNGQGSFAYGGRTPNANVEVEGEEVLQTPQGDIMEILGAKHEQGGVDMQLPAGTEVFSDRIKIDDESLADRKKKRTKKQKTLTDMLKKYSDDMLIQNTNNRTKQVHEQEEAQDKEIQNLVNFLKNPPTDKLAYGTTNPILPPEALINFFNDANLYQNYDTNLIDMIKKRNLNGFAKKQSDIISDESISNYRDNFSKFKINEQEKVKKVGINTIPTETRGQLPAEAGIQKMSLLNSPISLGDSHLINNIQTVANSENDYGNNIISLNAGKRNMSGYYTEDERRSLGENVDTTKMLEGLQQNAPVLGDAVGIAGNLFQAFAPYRNTLRARATDTPNINAFKNFGKDALQTLDSSKDYIANSRANKKNELNLSKSTSKIRNRNSARGVNTMRALDTAVDMQGNMAANTIDDSYNNAMMAILGNQSQMENQRDQMVMGGNQAKDIADRQDKGSFYSQLSRDLAAIGEGVSKTGKHMNQIKTREVSEAALNQISDYLQVSLKNGKITPKEAKAISQALGLE
jgi:hypothetical protein